MKERGENGKPFYVRVGFSEVHRPLDRHTPEDPAKVTLPAHVADTPGAREDFAMFVSEKLYYRRDTRFP